MRRGFLFAVAFAVLLHAVPAAQQATTNINVLPAHVDPADPSAFLKGDLFMQRQVEPAMAVSTRNPDHLMVFYNDYRAVDIGNDFGVGEQVATRSVLARLLARVFRLPRPERTRTRAAAEAFVGYSVSYDRGITWSGGLIPGSPKDLSAASLASPIRGVEAATDPVVMSAPCGYFYVAYVGFTRGPGGKSYLAVSRYQDRNNTENGDDIQYLDTRVLASANNDNPTLDTFVDKPAIGIDIDGPGSTSDACHHHAYVAYTVFDGPETSAGFKSRIMVARSPDSGQSWLAPVNISGPFAQNQGAAVAVTPNDDPGHIYVAWRQFKPGADAIVLAKSHNFGETWDPAAIISGSPLATFDQPSLGKPEPAFRTNGFPTLAVASNGRVFAAWQERVGFADCASNGPLCGRPMVNGSPRIVLMRSIDEGATWTDDRGALGKRRAIDFGDRCEPAVQPDFGTVECRASGPQVMPRLSTGAGRLMVTFYEARGELSGPPPGFIAGLNRRVDFRYAQLNASSGRLIAGAQVSKYDIRADANLADGQDESDLVQVAPGIPAVNRTNGLTSNAGTQPFLGDYTDLVPPVQFVNTNGGWRFATTPRRAGGTGFFAAFGDNRYQIPPTVPAALPVPDRYPFYSPPGTGMPSCINPGSRNTDIITSQLSADLVVGAPVTFKELANIQRSFPIYVSNRTQELRFFRLTINRGVGIASFDQVSDVNVVDAAILPQSGIVRTVYVNPTRALTNAVSIEVDQIDAIGGAEVPGGLTGGITLNADPSTEPAANPLVTNTETHNPLVTNNGAPLVTNYTVNPLVTNISKANPLVTNPLVTNQTASAPLVTNSLPPDQDVYGITDVTWEVQNAGNTSSSYLSLIDLPNGIDLQQFYKFQLTIFRRSYRATVDETCTVTNVGYDQVIANVPNPLVTNDLSQNPLVTNPLVTNPLVTNSTFAETPSPSAGQTGPTDGTTRAVRQVDRVFINLRGFKIVPQVPLNLTFGAPENLPRLAVVAQERNIVNGVREEAPPAAYFAPDLALVAEAPPSFSPSTIVAGGAGELDGAVMANIGNAAAIVPNDAVINDRVFLSSDNVLDATDIPLATGASFGTLQPGQSVNIGARPVVIPPVAAGNYFILRQVDASLIVSESNERNNVSVTPITVLSGAGAGSLFFETQPRDGIANQPIVPPMTVRARDAQGAVVPGLAVQLLLNTGQLLDKTSVPNDVSGTAELVGETTVVTDVSGLATFSGLQVNRPATGYSIVAAAPGALSRTSALFDMIRPEAVSCGAASFSVSPRLAMGGDPRSVALGDFNGDGRPDIVTANRASDDVSVRLGGPDGSFGEPAHVAVLTAPTGVAVADFNGDGFSDVFVISADSANILRGTPTGDLSLPAAVTISDGSASVTTGDFNQDGRADVAIAGTNGDGGGRVRIVFGDGGGGFLPQVTISLAADNPSAIKAADLNGDSTRDLVIANAAAGTVEVLFGLAGGTFSAGSTYPAGSGPVAVALGDLNGDLKPDIVTSTANGVAVLLAQAAGGFAAAVETPLGSDSRGVALGDFNGDGRLDVASANAEGFSLLPGDGAGGFLPPQSLDPNFEPRGLAIGDLDGDHRLDVVVVNGSPSNGVTILRNTCLPGPRTFVVTNTLNSGPGSLRQAILEANANPFLDTIRFRIGNGGLKTIVAASPLPTVIGATNIDGTTQPGYEGVPLVELTQTAGFQAQGLHFESDGNTVRGLVINGFGNGILMFGNNNVVQGNYLGTNPAGGAAALGNLIGITSIGANNLIGGAGAARNVASGNKQGIVVGGSGTTVQNNFVGTDVTGTMALGNLQNGIQITGSGHQVVNNLTSNNSIGIFATGSSHSITGNLVGTDVTGTLARGNGNGVMLTNGATNVRIGGLVAADRNVISANSYGLSMLTGSHGNFVQGNYIGTDITGQNALGNATHGVNLQDAGTTANTIGGPSAAARNVISGNLQNGVLVQFSGNTVQNNYIGVTAAGTAALANTHNGVLITSGSFSVVRDNVVAASTFNGIAVTSAAATQNSILNNRVGTDAAGMVALGNGSGIGIFGGASNTIKDNLVSGNRQYGITTSGNGTLIRGNRVGTNANGSGILGNSTHGFFAGIIAYSANNFIGGLMTSGEGNVVAGTNGYGIALWDAGATNNFVSGNLIGTDPTGLVAMGNTWGILVFNAGANNLLGGVAVAARNVVANSPQAGIGVFNTSGTTLFGNYIGTNINGTAAMPNGDGIELVNSTVTTIGGTTPGAANVIASSARYGMYIYQSSNNQVVGNRFGIGLTGTPLGNAEYGIVIGGSPSTNGNVLDSNVIAHNGAAGLLIFEGTGNVFRRNSIFSNEGLGIDIDGDGVTPNDPLDADTGPNGRLNFPVITSATTAPGLSIIQGTLHSKSNSAVTLEFFNSATCDPSGNGEGTTFVAEVLVTTNADGNASFSVALEGGIGAVGSVITATTRSAVDGTSEFSACKTITTLLGLDESPAPTPASLPPVADVAIRERN